MTWQFHSWVHIQEDGEHILTLKKKKYKDVQIAPPSGSNLVVQQ